MLKFNDGVQFDPQGPLRIESRHDGLYVVGNGMVIPVASMEDGQKTIKRLGGGINEDTE